MRIAMLILLAAFVVSASPAGADSARGAAWHAGLERSGIPALCARRAAEAAERERCVREQLEAGQTIRRLLVAHHDAPELREAVGACAASRGPLDGSYDWLDIRSCLSGWMDERAARSLRE